MQMRRILGILFLTFLVPVLLFILIVPGVMFLILYSTATTAFDQVCSIMLLGLYGHNAFKRTILIILNTILDVFISWRQ